MLKVGKFCCCCSLKSGATILGIVILLWGFMLAFLGSVGLMFELDVQLPEPVQMLLANSIGHYINDSNNHFEIERLVRIEAGERTDLTAFFVVFMTLGILEILAASSLLLGAVYYKPNFLVPMLILLPVELAFWISSICLSYRWFGIEFVFLVILSLLYGYFWVCIFSYWKQIKEEPGNAFGNWETPGVVHEAPVDQETTAV